MSNRRKGMWKLLYNLVNRKEVNLSGVYSVVNDILCQEPSLISCASVHELKHKFQDTFILWLLNKLAKCLSECTSKIQRERNVELQQNILTSCWANHPKLYEQLVLAYVDALQQLSAQLAALDYSTASAKQQTEPILQLAIFQRELSCLQEFDAQCSMQIISLPLDQADAYAGQLLLVLQRTQLIGHATHGALFVHSLAQALRTLKECDLDTKLSCLVYCQQVLRAQSAASWSANPALPHYALLSLRGLLMMWTLANQWLAAKCMTEPQLLQLAAHTQLLLQALEPLPRDRQSLELGCELLREILTLKEQQLELDSEWRNELLEALNGYLQQQLERMPSLSWPRQTLQLLFGASQLLPLLSLLGALQPSSRPTILEHLKQRLSQLLDEEQEEEQQLLAVLRALQHMEQLILWEQQQQLAKDRPLDSTLLAQLPLHYELPLQSNWNSQALLWLERLRSPPTSAQLQICALLLQLTGVRASLKPQTQQQLLSQLLGPATPATLTALSGIRLDLDTPPSSAHTQLQQHFASQHLTLLKENEKLSGIFRAQLPALYAAGYLKRAQLLQVLPKLSDAASLAAVLRLLLCSQQSGHVFRVEEQLELYCGQCRPLPVQLPGLYQGCCAAKAKSADSEVRLTNALQPAICKLLLFGDGSHLSQHLKQLQLQPALVLRLLSEAEDWNTLQTLSFGRLLPELAALDAQFMEKLAAQLLERIVRQLTLPLAQQRRTDQRQLLRLLVCCSQMPQEDLWLFHWFKLSFYFLLHRQSLVAQEAVLAASQLCAQHGLQTVTLWNWYKRDALTLVLLLALHAYLGQGVRFTRSLRALTKMLGFSCVQEFTCKYHRLLTTMVLPYCIREPRCKGVIVLIAKQLRKPVATLFATSFLRLYTHVYLTELPELGNRCIDLVVSCTQSSLQKLMNADVKQTVSELLIYYNRNPTFVMRSFQCLLQLNGSDTELCATQLANAEFSKFIAERFLGVITYFEGCLSEPSFEKPLKEQTLYSLGRIMRCVGAQHVTQFRFKIIAMLSFVHTLPSPQLQRICLQIWRIFLHVVNVQELGPSLALIVATLQPLLAESSAQVNELYEFLILRNASMLGSYIADLYFLERHEQLSLDVRQCIARHTTQLSISSASSSTLLEQLRFLHKQITNECLPVRLAGLLHLSQLFAAQRSQLNHMLLRELPMEPLLEQTVHVLMGGCQSDERRLQLASAQCLGELGAIDASYLPSNYNYAKPPALPLSVLTDDFAVLSLTALCRGYQCQQQSKHVDSFSLAIQETLAVCGIAPQEHKKRDLWLSLPERFRLVMEPLLKSCYTSTQRESSCRQQPIYGNHTRDEEWAYLWAERLLGYVQSSETRHLLGAYKPCIKRDGDMLRTFYPYILLHALLECSVEQREHMLEELLAVLQAAGEAHGQPLRPGQSYGQTSLEAGYKLYASRKYAASHGRDSSARPKEDSAVPRLASKLCAELLDFLQRWLREWQRQHGLSTRGKPPQSVDENYRRIFEFLAAVSPLLVAQSSYHCGEHARALSYLEQYIGDEQSRLLEQFSFLVEIYGRLMDPDSVEGAVQARSSYDMSVTQEILVQRLGERQQDMIICYEQLLCSEEQLQPEHIRAMIDAYLSLDTPRTALLIADGLWQRLADQYTDQYFSECKSELLWRLGSYEELQQLERRGSRRPANWHVQCAQACLALRHPTTSEQQFSGLLEGMRGSVLEQLRSCSDLPQHSYAHAYDEVLKLHMLHELQRSRELLVRLQQHALEDRLGLELTRSYFEDWRQRLEVLQPQLRVLEPIYSFRRNLLAELQRRIVAPALQTELQSELARLWLSSARLNRHAGQLQRAQLYLLKAAEHKPAGLFLERAQLLWQKGEQVLALSYLEEQLSLMREQAPNGQAKQLAGEQRALYCEGKYLQATYNAESMHLCAEAVLQCFQEALAVQRQSERCHVQLAQFLEKMRSAGKEQSDELLVQIMFNYAKSLRYGSEHVYQSMPRLISLWLDTAAIGSCNSELLRKLNDLLSNCLKALPTAMFYTAYSQLLSRLCHPSVEVYNVLRDIIIKLIEQYPQQSLWMLLPHFKSAVTSRIKRCKLILTDARLQTSSFQRLLSDFNTLTERLIELTNKEVALNRSYRLSELDKRLPKLFQQPDFSNILLPFEKYMQPTFPISSAAAAGSPAAGGDSSPAALNWFPYPQLHICGFQEQITVLRSAAKPKKLTIRCSDGQDYAVMVKPKDDLRKDARLMEFNGLVKRYLHQDAQARQRRLRIRTYAVLPFNEECGLLEWLPNLNAYRVICQGYYAQRGQGLAAAQLKQLELPVSASSERKKEVFLQQLLPAHPPVFQEWFRQRFTTPHSWWEARNAYVRTVAVMSMVGYILGLGDRHGENILFDERNGDAVHVDFNCLFNQGESFAYPELVPFRLTQNMIAAMGPLGVEGSYRKGCEITLRLLKQESKTLMSVLRPFVYDVGGQSRSLTAVNSASKSGAELIDPKATNDVQRIAERLQGHVKRHQANSIPLSTVGQVNFLINEATKLDNLAAMYIGWGAYL